jgi:hypothetical protein
MLLGEHFGLFLGDQPVAIAEFPPALLPRVEVETPGRAWLDHRVSGSRSTGGSVLVVVDDSPGCVDDVGAGTVVVDDVCGVEVLDCPGEVVVVDSTDEDVLGDDVVLDVEVVLAVVVVVLDVDVVSSGSVVSTGTVVSGTVVSTGSVVSGIVVSTG